ncbi:MAG: hypothetical protein AAGE85_07170 [Pseudomonadota bacterium]
MKPGFICPLLLAALAPVDTPADSLHIDASTTPVAIERGEPGRRQISLPAIEITATVSASCGAGLTPVALSLMTADTRLTVEEFPDGRLSEFDMQLSVPAAQLGPLSVKDFCLSGVEPAEPGVLRKKAFLSLHANLRCRGDAPASEDGGADSLTRRSTAVDMLIHCAAEDEISHETPLSRGGLIDEEGADESAGVE